MELDRLTAGQKAKNTMIAIVTIVLVAGITQLSGMKDVNEHFSTFVQRRTATVSTQLAALTGTRQTTAVASSPAASGTAKAAGTAASASGSTATASEQTVNGWETPSWGGYSLAAQADGSELVTFQKAKDYAYIAKPVPLTYTNGRLTNTVSVSFQNVCDSVSDITFYLQGDAKQLIGSGSSSYLEYYREKIGEYQAASGDGTVSLTFNIASALSSLQGKLTGGAKLVMMIESDPAAQKASDRKGSLRVLSANGLTVDYPENALTPWAADGKYTVEQRDNATFIRYSGLQSNAVISSNVLNFQGDCKYLNLELNNIGASAQSLTVCATGPNGETARVHTRLSHYGTGTARLKYNLYAVNPNLGGVQKISLLIDSDPQYAWGDQAGELEIISAYLSSC